MPNRFEVGIDGDASGLGRATAQAINNLNGLESVANRVSANVSRNVANIGRVNISGFQSSLRAGQISLGNFQAQAQATATALARPLTTGSNQAANALTNLGRVAQDAPFGFIGIQNNLNPLLESFQRLRAETGSNGAAFRALGQSLIGPAGLGIALSLVTAAVTFYTMYQQKANKATKEAKNDVEAYLNSLEELRQVQVRGAINAQKEITELNTLYSITQNVAISIKERKEAVDALQEKYPEYFKNLKDETVLNGNAEAAYKRLANQIIETARARAAEDKITKNSSRQLENDEKILDLQRAQIRNQAELRRARALERAQPISGGATGGVSANAFQVKAVGDALDKIAKTEKDINDLRIDSTKLNQTNLRLTDAITSSVIKGADLTDEKTGKTGDKIVSLTDILKNLKKAIELTEVQFQSTFGQKSDSILSAYQSAIDSATNAFGRQSKAVQDLINLQQKYFNDQKLFNLDSGRTPTTKGLTIGAGVSPTLQGGVNIPAVTQFREVQRGLIDEQIKFNEDFNKLIETGLAGSIGNIASSIGSALAEGGDIFKAAGNGLLAGFSQFLSQFGKLLVEYGAAAILKSKLDAAILIPGAGLFAGVAAVAAGLALQVAAAAFGSLAGNGRKQGSSGGGNNITAFADGGIVSAPTLGLIGEYSGARSNPEVVAPLNKLKSMLGDTKPHVEIIPITNSKELAIMVRYGNQELGRIG